MSSVALSYPLIRQRLSFAQEVKEAVKLARELGFGQQAELSIETVADAIEGLRIVLTDCDRCWN